MKTFKEYLLDLLAGSVGETSINEMGAGAVGGGSAGPTNVTGAQSSTDPASASAVNRKKKRNPILMGMATRKAPK